MKLKTILLFTALCSIAMAQDFHGVTMSGTNAPIITNSPSNPPLLGLVYVRLDSNGLNAMHHDVDYARILTGKLIQPGEVIGGAPGPYLMTGTFKWHGQRIDSTGKRTNVVEGNTLGHKVIAVLFADGTFYSQATGMDLQLWQTNSDGTPKLDESGNGIPITDTDAQARIFRQLSVDISTIRGMGQSLQGLTAADRKLALSRMSLPDRPTPGVSKDPSVMKHKVPMAIMLSQLTEEDQTAAIDRLAALPDVVKGN